MQAGKKITYFKSKWFPGLHPTMTLKGFSWRCQLLMTRWIVAFCHLKKIPTKEHLLYYYCQTWNFHNFLYICNFSVWVCLSSIPSSLTGMFIPGCLVVAGLGDFGRRVKLTMIIMSINFHSIKIKPKFSFSIFLSFWNILLLRGVQAREGRRRRAGGVR